MATIIYNATQLQAMEGDLTADYELGSDIDASATAGWNGGLGFDPIGTFTSGVPADAFSGSFDGKGHKITGLTINRPLEDYVGLFGYILGTGEIKNVGFESVAVAGDYSVAALVGFHDGSGKLSNCYSTGTIQGRVLAGGLLGYNQVEVEDCHSDCVCSFIGGASDVIQCGGLIGLDSSPTGVTRCYATGNITATSDDDIREVGGLVGYSAYNKFSRCYATGNVTITAGDLGYSIGGFIGFNGGTDGCHDCYSTGNVTATVVTNTFGWLGGFCGLSDAATLKDCYSTGLVTKTAGQPDVGGFVGENASGGTVVDCFWDTETSGQATSDGGTGKTTSQMKAINTFQEAEWLISTIWNLISTCNDGYPCLIDVNICCVGSSSNRTDQSIVGNKVTLEALRNIEMQYGGKCLVDKSGNFVYQSRYHRNV